MMRARFDEAARQEFLAEVAYYDSVNPELAHRFSIAVEAAVAQIETFPHAGRRLERGSVAFLSDSSHSP